MWSILKRPIQWEGISYIYWLQQSQDVTERIYWICRTFAENHVLVFILHRITTSAECCVKTNLL